jgi:large subunit ribosomal protein L4e
MKETDVLSLDGRPKGKVSIPSMFDESVRPELIQRAVIAENTMGLQPQGHYPLAGMQTTARYYGRMHAYRTGRHMGVAIRPKQKLGGGVQGAVRRIPSSVKGKRAHPHLVEKIIAERINKKEYQKALASAVSATGKTNPIIVADEIESVSKTKDMLKIFNNLNLKKELGESSAKARIRKGLRRSSKIKRYRKSILLVVGKESGAIKAARNMKGVDACPVSKITANLLAPGGIPGRTTVWSESAIKNLEESISKQSI